MKPPLELVFASTVFALAVALGFPSSASAQDERAVQAQHERNSNRNFAEQLQRILGRFRIVDLQRIFDTARPLSCSELVGDAGEWREVAFLNEHPAFGDWYRDSFDEVRSDLGVYTFNSPCAGQLSPVQVTTSFPVEDSLEAYRTGKIHFRDIHVNINAPVTAHFDNQTGAYRFDLPYLFRVSGGDADRKYALSPRRLTDRYAPEVTNRWECKSIEVPDGTYDFLICRTTMVLLDTGSENKVPYGALAFSILSDGKEAFSSVKLTFGDSTSQKARPTGALSSEPPRLGFRDLQTLSKDK